MESPEQGSSEPSGELPRARRARRGHRQEDETSDVGAPQEGGQPEAGERGAAPEGDLLQRFDEAYNQYGRALQQIWASDEFLPRAQEAYRDYARALQEIWSPPAMQARATQALRGYTQSLQEAMKSEDVAERSTAAYRSYVRMVEESGPPADSAERAREAYRRYLGALREALTPAEMERQVTEVYETYVRALKDGWAAADATQLDLGSIWRISMNMNAAAGLTASAREALRQRWTVATMLAAAIAPG